MIAVDGDTYSVTSAVAAVRGAITTRSPRKIATLPSGCSRTTSTPTRWLERISLARPTRTTPLMFEHALIERAQADRRHIVLPEGNDDRVLLAAEQLLRRGVVDLTVLGTERDVRARAAALALTLPGVHIVDPLTSPSTARISPDLLRAAQAQGSSRPTSPSTRWATCPTSAR